ncbi:MAG: PilN domain-containing protein, partial [Pirellulales bacterium]
DVRREFAELEERSLRYLTLGPGRKALAGNIQQLDARHQYALLTVANQKTLDLLMKIADTVGVQIEAIEPSLIALSRTQAHLQNGCQEACLLIQVDEGAAELGICHRGRLLLDYRPGGQTNAENVADVVALHSTRLRRYLQRYHSYLDSPLQHVYLTGDPEAVDLAQKKFSKLKQFQVEVLNPADLNMNWQHTADVPGTNLAAALGSALLIYPEAAEQQAPNLIASTLAELRPPIRPVLIRSLMPIAAMLLVAATLLVLHLREWRETASLRAELDQLAPACTRATELRLKQSAADAKLAQLAELEKLLPQPNWQQILGRITQSMPDDVWLDRLSVHDGKDAKLTGASYTDGGVYDFVANLKQVPDVAEIALEGTGVGQSVTGPTTNFDLQLTLADFAGRNGSEDRHD